MRYTVGTNIFASTREAITYYKQQGITLKEVYDKIRNEEIFIGKFNFDKIHPNSKHYIDKDGRFHICES